MHRCRQHVECQVEIYYDYDREREGLGRCLARDTAVDVVDVVVGLSKVDIAADWMHVAHGLASRAGSRRQLY